VRSFFHFVPDYPAGAHRRGVRAAFVVREIID
jgi:hypothetical protein